MPRTHRKPDRLDESPEFHRDRVVDGWRFTCEHVGGSTYRLTISDLATDPKRPLHAVDEELRLPKGVVLFTGDAAFAERAFDAAERHRVNVFTPADLMHDLEGFFRAERHQYERVWSDAPKESDAGIRAAWKATKDAVRRHLVGFGILKDAPAPPKVDDHARGAMDVTTKRRGNLRIVRKP